MQIIITSFEQLEKEGSTAVGRKIDAAIQAHAIDPTAPISPTITGFLEVHGEPIRAWNGVQHRERGKGLIYIQDRLDEPARTTQDENWIKPFRWNVFGSYIAVYVPLSLLQGLVNERVTAAIVEQYAEARTAVLHCRVADAADPEHKDRPYIAVIQEEIKEQQ